MDEWRENQRVVLRNLEALEICKIPDEVCM